MLLYVAVHINRAPKDAAMAAALFYTTPKDDVRIHGLERGTVTEGRRELMWDWMERCVTVDRACRELMNARVAIICRLRVLSMFFWSRVVRWWRRAACVTHDLVWSLCYCCCCCCSSFNYSPSHSRFSFALKTRRSTCCRLGLNELSVGGR